MKRQVSCPTCSKPVEWSEAQRWRPFCSERCRLIDLGEWASEGYAVPAEEKSDWPELEQSSPRTSGKS